MCWILCCLAKTRFGMPSGPKPMWRPRMPCSAQKPGDTQFCAMISIPEPSRRVSMHTEDRGARALHQWETKRADAHFRYRLDVYQQVCRQPRCRLEAGGMQRSQPPGPQKQPRKARTNQLWAKHHALQDWEAMQACTQCAHTCCRGRLQARLEQWRQLCVLYQEYTADAWQKDIAPFGAGLWQCSRCHVAPRRLAKTAAPDMWPAATREAETPVIF